MWFWTKCAWYLSINWQVCFAFNVYPSLIQSDYLKWHIHPFMSISCFAICIPFFISLYQIHCKHYTITIKHHLTFMACLAIVSSFLYYLNFFLVWVGFYVEWYPNWRYSNYDVLYIIWLNMLYKKSVHSKSKTRIYITPFKKIVNVYQNIKIFRTVRLYQLSGW